MESKTELTLSPVRQVIHPHFALDTLLFLLPTSHPSLSSVCVPATVPLRSSLSRFPALQLAFSILLIHASIIISIWTTASLFSILSLLPFLTQHSAGRRIMIFINMTLVMSFAGIVHFNGLRPSWADICSHGFLGSAQSAPLANSHCWSSPSPC